MLIMKHQHHGKVREVADEINIIIRAHGSTWARPVGWRGTDHPFPILLLARHFRHWRRLAACGGLGWTARRELCHAAFSRWLQWYLDTPAVEASFAWADFVDDDI